MLLYLSLLLERSENMKSVSVIILALLGSLAVNAVEIPKIPSLHESKC